MQRIIFLALCLGFLACEQPAEPVRQAQTNSATQDQSSEEPEQSRTREERPDRRFYQITEERPEQVCGREGFEYLWRGFLVKECGTCHYADNRFNITAFADRRNLELSWEVMQSQVDLQEFVHAVVENPFCNACLLHASDPLREDITFFASNVRSCPTPD